LYVVDEIALAGAYDHLIGHGSSSLVTRCRLKL
jgi:hypothetical protein